MELIARVLRYVRAGQDSLLETEGMITQLVTRSCNPALSDSQDDPNDSEGDT